MPPLIRVGVEGSRRPVLELCRTLGAPLLVSANSLWNPRRQCFTGYGSYRPFDVALDSGGFVAMRKYGRYRYTPAQYAALAADLRPSWWAQMDFCCEPELAASPAERARRIDLTVEHLHLCQSAARTASAPPPMPVLQGWTPADYTSGPAFDPSFVWPSLVGVGSVCRRPLHGSTGVLAIVDALNRRLPPHVRLHLFGVKSGAVREILHRYPSLLASVDSMAWNAQARWNARHGITDASNVSRAQALAAWYPKQLLQLDPPPVDPQPLLPGL